MKRLKAPGLAWGWEAVLRRLWKEDTPGANQGEFECGCSGGDPGRTEDAGDSSGPADFTEPEPLLSGQTA